MDIDISKVDQINSWPFQEARLILKKINKKPEKGYILFQSGYGASGLPHIGTFGEVSRTQMIMNAFGKISEIPTKLITFSDDYDALRKVPENLPNQKMLKENLGKPVSSIPDPFGKYQTLADNVNNKLKSFLDNFGIQFELKSATELYKSGFFDKYLLKVLKNYKKITEIVLPTIGPERRSTYSPILPISKKTGKILQVPIEVENEVEGEISFTDEDGENCKTNILKGNCKLQWKVDWAMRWYALDVDFEMYGKDLIESAILSTKIINLIGKKNPSGFAYELFLDEKGEKISKSKGNGITIDQWLGYASPESLSLYMYQNPKRAKKLYKEIVPKAVDDYLDCIEKSKKQNELQLLMNPAWHVHNGEVPQENMIMTFSMLLNLVETSNADNKELLWKFVKKYKQDISEKNFPIFDGLVGYAIKYFNDVIKAQKKYKTPSESEKLALQALVKTLEKCTDDMSPEDIQTLIYSTGKENGYADNLRDWFKLIYEVIFGDENGPRMGFFISFFGVNETKELLMNKLK